ncbi:multifunctional methyltransferase subunit TRM112 homolog A-like [Cyclospora cayetanensis]|uniref:Multifunctional methyltransferase subunit TRM112 homolog A-like n=1 Tax=Cyclospora cayetanensis TaxID=88456 RepID=A0A6P6RQI6_9EIME|nr:multifunctional methyltransferase subunit TRM112 homolog A-like [Cyclospora cayetanensis]
MRLLTHNLLMCNRRQCSGGYPLLIKLGEAPSATKHEETELQTPLLLSLLKKLDWQALVQTASELGMDLPSTFSESDKADENFLRALQAAVLDLHILEGALICPTCKREYPVSKGIPNMLLQDDEV